MQQLLHKAIGVAFWLLLAGLWVALVDEGRAGAHAIAYSAQYVAVIAGAVLAVTIWWVRHNVRIYEKKGPRTVRAAEPPRIDEDRLGRPVRWQLEGGHAAAVGCGHLVVALDGEAKVYRAPGA